MNARPTMTAFAALRARWQAAGARERRAVALAGGVLGAFLVWAVALQPALRTLRDAPAQIEALDAQLQQMRSLAAGVDDLRGTPPLPPGQAEQALKAASDRLGPHGRLLLQGDRAVLTLNGASAEALQDWLDEARGGARARPVEAQLARSAQGFSGSITVVLGGAR